MIQVRVPPGKIDYFFSANHFLTCSASPICDPQGNVMGGGNTKSVEDGPTITYTKTTNFYYENSALDVCDYISNYSGEFAKGNYMVNVYDDRLKLLATNKFELK